MAGIALRDVLTKVAGKNDLLAPPPPDLTDELIIRKQLETKQRLSAMQGRSGTFLTGPAGLGGPSGEMALAFLRAKLDENPFGNLPMTNYTTESPPPPGLERGTKPKPPPGQRVPNALGSLWSGY